MGNRRVPFVQRYHVAFVVIAELLITEVLAALRLAEHAAHGVFGALLRSNLREDGQHALVHIGFDVAVGDFLHDAFEPNAVFFHYVFVVVLILHVAREAVKLPDNDHVEPLLLAVIDHLNESWTIIAFARKGVVRIYLDHVIAVLHAIVRAGFNLIVNGRVALLVATETRVYCRADFLRNG